MTFDGEEEHDGPAHHPSAPTDELFDISTAVDPSYIISLIRKLIPTNQRNCHNANDVDGRDVPSKGLMEESSAAPSEDRVLGSHEHNLEAMDIVSGFDRSSYQDGEVDDSCHKLEQPGVSTGDEVWEEYGCILWDLAASSTHAEFMVQNLVLEVLLANFLVSHSVRVTEIILGTIGNLACHEVLMKSIASTNGLIALVVDQLFLDDTQCLVEAFRLLTLCLQGSECTIWAEVLQSEHILQRILWIVENTLNLQLTEKSLGMLLAILEGQQEVALILHPPLMKLGLSKLLVDLLAFEMNKLMSERIPERYSVLDVILRAVEALSVLDDYSQEISSKMELLQLLCNLIKFPEKVEVANSCVTAGVVIANILSDIDDLASDISQEVSLCTCPDLPVLQGLLQIISFASDDLEARSALWSVIARLLVKVQEDEMSVSSLHQYVSVLLSTSEMIEDDLLDCQLEDCNKEEKKAIARITAIRRIISILKKWTTSRDGIEEKDVMGDHVYGVNVGRLLDCCCKYIESFSGG